MHRHLDVPHAVNGQQNDGNYKQRLNQVFSEQVVNGQQNDGNYKVGIVLVCLQQAVSGRQNDVL